MTDEGLLGLLKYEREIESQRGSVERVERSLRKIARIQAELARRAGREVEEIQVRGHAGSPREDERGT